MSVSFVRVFSSLTILLGSVFYPGGSCLAEPASNESIQSLYEVTRVKDLTAQSMGQVEQHMRAFMQKMLTQLEAPEDKKQQALDLMNQLIPMMVAKTNEVMKWENLEPRFTTLYRETFTEKEVRGMLDFYATPAGQALLNKMPILMQKTMSMTQQLMAPFFIEFSQEMKAKVQKLIEEQELNQGMRQDK